MERILSNRIGAEVGKVITVEGWVHKLRKLGAISFLVIRDRAGLVQAILDAGAENDKIKDLTTETVVRVTGKVVAEERAPQGAEMHVEKVEILSPVTEDVPVSLNKKTLNVNLDTLFDHRPLTLRAPSQRAIFKVQGEILAAFRDYLSDKSFTEINTPKIVEAGLETGGAEMFSFKYFGKKAFLSQSPQMYKQIMVGVYERVFETAFIYRAEKHSTSRHLNEYLSLDLEIGFIKSWTDIMDLEEDLLKVMMKRLAENSGDEFTLLEATIPDMSKPIPRLKLTEVQAILEKEYKEKCVGEPDLEPNHERLICEYAARNLGSEFVFVTHYPTKKRPFYAMDDPESPEETLSFDLLFRGVEITTGGQRLHLYADYLEKMKSRNMNIEDFSDYLSVFKFGMPPHGGLAIGCERLTAKLLGLDNAKEASLFPRDINRLTP